MQKLDILLYSMNLDTNTLEQLCLLLKRNGYLKFPVYYTPIFLDSDLEHLNLSVRSFNCLKRVGIKTLGDLVESIDRMEDLLKIRNLGLKSAHEIMCSLLYYQYSILPDDGKKKMKKRIIELNCH